MNDQGTVLTDADQRIWLDSFRIENQANDTVSAIDKWTIRGGPGDGIDVVEIDNGRLCVSLLPTRGMGLWKARCDDLLLGWDSPVNRPVHPSLVRPGESGGAGWLGGFQELLARCGLAWHGPPGIDSADGRPLTLHGRVANLPAHRVTTGIADDGRLWVRGEVDETALFGPCLRLDSTVSTNPGSNRLTILDTVTNLAGTTADFEVLYHTNIGSPLLEPGSRLVAPISSLFHPLEKHRRHRRRLRGGNRTVHRPAQPARFRTRQGAFDETRARRDMVHTHRPHLPDQPVGSHRSS